MFRRSKKEYPYPSVKNPIILPDSPHQARQTLCELSQRIEKDELVYYKKPAKIPALPSLFMGKVSYDLWCFECFKFIREACHHRIIKNRHDARFWGLKEKKALCGECLEQRLGEMSPRKRYLWKEYQKRGYWKIN